MDSDTVSKKSEPEAYWRRRVYLLAAGLVGIGLIAWACSGSGGDDKTTAQARNAAAMASASAAAGRARPAPTATVTVTVTPPATPHQGNPCKDTDLVAGLVPTKTTYRGKAHPRFRLSVVNMASRTCTFDVGAKHLQVLITSGSHHIWSSAKCGAGPVSEVRSLRRGIPYVGDIDWNRKPCGHGRAAGSGTYVITATEGKVATKRHVFRLR